MELEKTTITLTRSKSHKSCSNFKATLSQVEKVVSSPKKATSSISTRVFKGSMVLNTSHKRLGVSIKMLENRVFKISIKTFEDTKKLENRVPMIITKREEDKPMIFTKTLKHMSKIHNSSESNSRR